MPWPRQQQVQVLLNRLQASFILESSRNGLPVKHMLQPPTPASLAIPHVLCVGAAEACEGQPCTSTT